MSKGEPKAPLFYFRKMKFGFVDNPDTIDYSLPSESDGNLDVLSMSDTTECRCYVGLSKMNPNELENFYPKGFKTKNLEYYSTQFNTIEMNAFFYRIFDESSVNKWYDRAESNFRFCPKFTQSISQFRRLKNCDAEVDRFVTSVSAFRDKLGVCFLQMHPSFSPGNYSDLEAFLNQWPQDLPLAVEVRHPEWFSSNWYDKYTNLLKRNNQIHIITDTSGRRDMVKLSLTAPKTFIRFVATDRNETNQKRIENWVEVISNWAAKGLQECYFMVHQHPGKESPDLARTAIGKMESYPNIVVPKTGNVLL